MSNDLKKDIMQGSNTLTQKSQRDVSANVDALRPPQKSIYTQQNNFRPPQVLTESGTINFDND